MIEDPVWCSSAWAFRGVPPTTSTPSWPWSTTSRPTGPSPPSPSAATLAYPAAAVLAGGNVPRGLEDNLYLGKGVFATNAQLVEKAVSVIEGMGASVIGPAEVRNKLKLQKR